jgi:hypothetical protein
LQEGIALLKADAHRTLVKLRQLVPTTGRHEDPIY